MHLGLVGLDNVGLAICERLRSRGHGVTGYDATCGSGDVDSLAALVDALPTPRVVWVMVPAGAPTRQAIGQLVHLLEEGDLVVDAGDSRFTEDLLSTHVLAERGIRFLDCGVTGGVDGRWNGYALTLGGSAIDIDLVMPVLDALRPEGGREDSVVHAGPTGAGHYAKLIHTGIEYGMMQALAEGYELLTAEERIADAPAVLRAWSRGSDIRSRLLDLLVEILAADPELASTPGRENDIGTGGWVVEEAIAHAVPTPVTTAALFTRFASHRGESPSTKVISALESQFDGRAVRHIRPAKSA